MVKLIGIMVFSVFVDSKSILGLFYGKKCSEIVFFPRCLLSTNRDLTLVVWLAFSVVQDGIFDHILAGGISFLHGLDDDTRRLA